MIISFLFFDSATLFAQTDTLFWFSAPEVNRYHSGGSEDNPRNFGTPVYLRLTTQDLPANVTISMPANPAFTPITRSIAANTTHTENLSAFIINATTTAQGGLPGTTNIPGSIENVLAWTLSNLAPADGKPYINRNEKGIKIVSDAKITAYYEIGVLYNMDLIALKGQNGLGTKFYVPFQTSNNTRDYNVSFRPYNSIDIVATKDNTKINITVTNPIWVKGYGRRLAGTYTIWLDAGQTAIIPAYRNLAGSTGYTGDIYQTTYTNTLRLAGSYVEVDQTEGSGAPIAVITHDDIVVSQFSLNPDYVTDQLVPIEHIGTDYAVIQGVGYNATEIEDYVFVVGTQDGTNFTVKRGPADVTTTHTVDERGSVAITMNNQNYRVVTVNSDQPVYVYHMSGTGRQKAGALIPTISNCTGSTRVAFNRTRSQAAGYDFYLTILAWAKAGNSSIGNFRLLRDNADVTLPSEVGVINAINNPASFSPLPETGVPYENWQYARIDASGLDANVAYLLVNDENVFHLGVINGRTSNDAFYGYFSNFNQFDPSGLVVENNSPGGKFCPGITIQLYAEGGAKYSWNPTDFLDDPNIHNPTASNVTYSVPYQVTVSGACDFSQTLDIPIQVGDPVVANFMPNAFLGCAVPPVPGGTPEYTFTFTSTSQYDSIRTWVYRLGPTGTNTQFAYGHNDLPPADQAHVVDLTLTNDTDTILDYYITLYVQDKLQFCIREVTKVVRVYPYIGVAPTANPTSGCQPLDVNFFANPQGEFVGATYAWEFGDGASHYIQNPTHQFINPSPPYDPLQYYSKVTITDQWNICNATDSVLINVSPYIDARFTVSKVEGCSPLNTTITNTSKGAINTYTWTLYRNSDPIQTLAGFDPPDLSNLQNVRTDNLPDEYLLRLEVNHTLYNCPKQFERIITVWPVPNANTAVTPQPNTSCSPLDVEFDATDIVNADEPYHWMLDDIPITSNATGTFTLDNYTMATQTRQMWFELDNIWGCTFASAPVNIDVHPYIEANIVLNPEEICPDPVTGLFEVDILNASLLADGYFQWTINGVTEAPNTNVGTCQFDYSTLTLNGDGSADIPVSLTVTNGAGCVSTDDRTIFVKPQVTGSFTAAVDGNPITAGIDVLCSPVTIDFTSSMTHADSYFWQFGTLGASVDENPSFEFTNTGDTPLDVVVTLTANSPFGCSAVHTETYTIQPEVRAEYSINTTAGCTPLTIVVEAPNLAGVTYEWNFNGGAFTGNAQTFATISTNETGEYLYLPITLTATRGPCTATNTDQIITVYPDVDAKWSGTALDPTCSPANPSLTNNSDGYNPALPVTNIQWQVFDPADVLVESSSDQLFEPELTNTSHLVTQDYRIRLTATSIDGCTDFHEETITIYPTPNALFNVTVIENCTPMVIEVTDASTTISQADYTWDWDGEDNLESLGNQNYIVTYENNHPTDEEVKLIVLDLENQYGCVNSYGYQFSVLPQVNASIALAAGYQDRLCGSEEIIFDNFSTGGLPGALTFSWDFDDGTSPYVTTSYNPVPHTFINNTTDPLYRDVTLTVTNSSGCTNDAPAIIPITVYPRVVAAQSFEITDVCSGTTIDLTNASSNATVPNSTFTWEFTTSSALGDDQTVTYPPGPLGGINLVNNHPTDPIVYNLAFTASTLWNPGGDEHTCFDPIAGEDVTVYPILDVLYDSPAAVCSGLNGAELEFLKNANSSGGYEADVVLEWWFGDGNTMSTNFVPSVNKLIENLSEVDFITQTRIFARQVATGCTQERFVDVRVHPKVEARFTSTIHDNDNCTYPLRVDFVNSSVFHDLQPEVDTYFHWNYGNSGEGGTPAEETLYDSNPHHRFFYNAEANAIATYDVTLTVNQYHEISGETCADDSVKTVTVYPELIADFSLGPPSGCNPLTVIYNNQSSGVLHSLGGSYEWNLGDNTGSILETPGEKIYSHTDKTQSLFYPVTLTVTNPLGCTKEITHTVEVYPLVIANFMVDITEGCTPLDVTAQNLSTSLAYQYLWNFGTGIPSSISENPGTVSFVNTTLGILNRVITLTTGLSSDYPETCSEEKTWDITVFPHIYPDFWTTLDLDINSDFLAGCHPFDLPFTNLTEAYSSNSEYLWNFGNGIHSTEFQPSQRFVNTSLTEVAQFDVRLDAISEHGCTDFVERTVTVYPKPKSIMMLSDFIDCPPFDVEIINQSQGTNLLFEYDFGDGTDSYITTDNANVIHTFYNSNDETEPYVVTLNVTSEYGCEDFSTQIVFVYPEVRSIFSLDPQVHCNPITPTITNLSSANAYYYYWDFDDGHHSNLFEPIHRFVNTTTEDVVFNVSLRVESVYECYDQVTLPLTVFAAPIADFAINPPLNVFPKATFQMLNFSDPADPNWSYLWNYGDGYGDDQSHMGAHTYTYETWGPKQNKFRYLVTLEIWNDNCYDSVWHYLTLLPPEPIVFFYADHYQSCSPLEVYFINNSQYGDSCLWNFGYFDDEGNPVTSNEWEPFHVFVEPGYYNVGLTVWGDGGEKHYFATFQVFENPIARFEVLPERVMLPQATVRLFNLSENAYSSIWDLGDGTISTLRDPIHTYKELGEYRITLTVYTEYGCEDTESKYPAVWVEGAGYIKFPNAFVPSPHGPSGGYYDAVDFKNEVFHPYSDGVLEYRLMVFNRWGEQIFQSSDIKVGWDGYYQDKLCDQGVYVWRAVGKFANGKQFDIRGNVTLLR